MSASGISSHTLNTLSTTKADATWEKVLWRRQPYPDNYVPPTFLSELRRLPPRPRPAFFSLVAATLPVMQHLALIALFLAVFYGMLEDTYGASEVGWSCAGIGIVSYCLWHIGWGSEVEDKESTGGTLLPAESVMRPILLPPLLISLFSPVLGTLTSATTSDSIWPLAGGLFFVHLLLADFSTGPDTRRRVRLRRQRRRSGSVGGQDKYIEEKSLSSSLSLTSALSASVVLASRLPSTAHVFSLTVLAVCLFAGWPTLAKGVRETGPSFSLALTASMVWLSISLFPANPPPPDVTIWRNPIPSGFTLTLVALLLLVSLVGPLMLWWGWRWKTRRGGNWDVAIVKLRHRRE